MITGSGGLSISKYLDVPFLQEVISVSTAPEHFAPKTDVAIELGGRMPRSFISPMVVLSRG